MEEAALTRRRRLLVWLGVALAFAGSLAVLYVGYRRRASDLRQLIELAARRHGVDADLIEGVVYAESGGNAEAVSRAQAYGLMQIRVPTASEVAGRDIRVDELFDPQTNLDLGCRYLRKLLARYDGDVRLALMAYNAGPGNLARWRRAESDPAQILEKHAFPATRAYVRTVLNQVRELKSRE